MRREINILNNIDWITILIYLLLVFFGWLNIYAAVYSEEHKSIFDLNQRYGNQAIWILAAIIIAIVTILMDTKFFTFFAYFIYGFSILLLIAVLVIGKEINGARAWIGIGKFSIQPAEFAKVATALALSKFLSGYNIKINNFKTLLIIGFLIFVPIAFIALQPDAGSILVFASFSIVLYREGLPGSILIFGALIGILFFLSLIASKIAIISGLIIIGFIIYPLISKYYKETLIGLLGFALITLLVNILFKLIHKTVDFYFVLSIGFILSGIGYLVYNFFRRIKYIVPFVLIIIGSIVFTFSVDYVFHKLPMHQQDRMLNLLGLKEDPLGMGYNVNQSLIAIGSGGFSGKGFLQGTQTKYNFVPEQTTDFIFCTVGEEWGFLGTLTIISLFVVLMMRIIILAERQRSLFTRIYAYCVVSIIFFHFSINIGMAIGLLPVIGIPLPFFSYGGSSLWAFTLLLFILVRFDASRMELLR